MAKKKGSQRKRTSAKKKSSKSKNKGSSKKKQQKKQAPVEAPVEEPVVEEELPEPPAPEPEPPAEEEKAKVGDTVAAVIGTDEKKDKKEKKKSPTLQKREKLILQWTAEGYNVEYLEELLESGAKKGVKKAFDDCEEAIVKIDVIKSEIEDLDTSGIEEQFAAFEELLKFPERIDEINDEYAKMDGYRRAGELRAELDKMVLPKFKDRVDEVREMLKDVDNLEAAEEALVNLKKDYKEAYFEEGVAASIGADDGPAVQKTAKAKPAGDATPMNVRDIFLLYRNGKFISHHTGRVVPKEEQEQLFADLKTGRNYLKSPNYKPQKLNVISVNGRKILVQGGQFTVVVMIAEGNVNPFTERIVAKVLGLMEKEDRVPLMNWNGDVSALKSAGKYMTALLYAVMKLGKK